MSGQEDYIPFSQRTALKPIPPQLRLGEVSREFRLLIDYAISKEIDRGKIAAFEHYYFGDKWLDVATDFHVKFRKRPISSFEKKAYLFRKELENFVMKEPLGSLFDLIEFFAQHNKCSEEIKSNFAEAFVSTRAAYRMVGSTIVTTGTAEQGRAFESAISATEEFGTTSARNHLLKSGAELRAGNWSDSVRESIHAVEAIARRFEPDANTLGPALKLLEKKGHIHGSLKAAFEKLYGYTNDEDGIRHALLEDVARVDEADALFMLGACASFVSYLISRKISQLSSELK